MNCIFFFAELETEAMEVFREYLKDKYQDIERFFNEWKMTFHSDGSFKTEQDLHFLSEKMTKPDDFMVRNLPPMSRPVGISGVMLNFKKSKNKRRAREKKVFSLTNRNA